MKKPLFSALALSAALVGCQTITEEAPSTPTGGTNPIVSVPLPLPKATPKPAATPTPNPVGTPTPKATPTPAPTATPIPPDPPGPTGTCVPEPPPLHHIGMRVHNNMGFKKIIDSAPNICDAEYCSVIMKDPARRCCPIKAEGHPDREFCEALVTGVAADTGRAGPQWSMNGQPCLSYDPGGTTPRCVNHWDNQYLIVVYGAGTVRGCSTRTGICGEVIVQ